MKMRRKAYLVRLNGFIDGSGVGICQTLVVQPNGKIANVSIFNDCFDSNDPVLLELWGLQNVIPQLSIGFRLYIETMNRQVYDLFIDEKNHKTKNFNSASGKMVHEIVTSLLDKRKWGIYYGKTTNPFGPNKVLTVEGDFLEDIMIHSALINCH